MAIMLLYCQVNVAGDILFLKRIPFFISISLHLKFGTVECLENCRVPTLVKAVRIIKKTYALQGFNLAVIKMGPDLEPLRTGLADYNILLNICAENEHVLESERCIRTFKERYRGTYSAISFKRIPAVMVVSLVCADVFWLHVFPAPYSVPSTFFPCAIVTGQTINFHKHCQI